MTVAAGFLFGAAVVVFVFAVAAWRARGGGTTRGKGPYDRHAPGAPFADPPPHIRLAPRHENPPYDQDNAAS